jgi:hypothetical protein
LLALLRLKSLSERLLRIMRRLVDIVRPGELQVMRLCMRPAQAVLFMAVWCMDVS